jgi:hypothetical protein
MVFQKAEKTQAKLRLAIEGASGSGKTYSSLILATSIGKKIAVVDTEHGSASLYADKFNFDVLELRPPYEPERYVEAIKEAEAAGYDVIVLDSITHEWNGEGGALDLVTKIGGSSYSAWAKVTPRHDKFINAILQSKCHVIATMRSKANYETGKDERTGKMTIEKKGTAPIQRDSVDYEFTVVFDLNQRHMANVSKDRTSLFDGRDFQITAEVGQKLLKWLNDGRSIVEVLKNKRAQLQQLINTKQFDAPKFWNYYNCDIVDGIPAEHLDYCIDTLSRAPDKSVTSTTASPKQEATPQLVSEEMLTNIRIASKGREALVTQILNGRALPQLTQAEAQQLMIQLDWEVANATN